MRCGGRHLGTSIKKGREEEEGRMGEERKIKPRGLRGSMGMSVIKGKDSTEVMCVSSRET